MKEIVILLDKDSTHRRKDENGYLIVENNPIAFSGVYPYLLSEIDENSKSDDIVSVYRPYDDLLNNKEKFKNKPIIWEHKWTGKQGDNQKADGAIFGDIEAKENGLFADLIIYNKDLINAIEKGECYELSPGYEAEVLAENGVFDGKPYSYKQKLLNVNHLAVVERGRTGHELRIQDENLNTGAEKMTLKSFWEKFKRFGDAEIEKEFKEDEEVITDSDDEIEVLDNDEVIVEDECEEVITDSDDEIEVLDNDEIITDSDDEIIEDECESDTTKIKDEFEKVINKLVDKRLNSYRAIDEAILQVEKTCGKFNTNGIKTTDDAYAVGYKMLTGDELPKGYEPKTAFIMAKAHATKAAKVTDSKNEPSIVDEILKNF